MKPVNELSLDEARDELAEMDGWVYCPDAIRHLDSMTGENVKGAWRTPGGVVQRHNLHPFPPTLDAAAAATERLWKLTIYTDYTGVWTIDAVYRSDCELCIEAPTELLARYRLAVACRRAKS